MLALPSERTEAILHIELRHELAIVLANQKAGLTGCSAKCTATLRACWIIQSRTGLALMPTMYTRRLWTWMKDEEKHDERGG